VISQVYGGGGNTGGVYRNDFIELFNRGNETISLEGWSVQYTSATGPTTGSPNWLKTNLSGTIEPGQYRLIQEAAGASITQPLLPSPDIITGPPAVGAPIAMGANAGKVALVRNTTPLTCGSATNECLAEAKATIADLVGYGSGTGTGATSFFEGTGPTGPLANSTAAVRQANGCTDTDDNAADFNVTTPSPRNGQSARVACDVAPPPPPGLPDTRFVELHYDNDRSDVNEALEIEGPAGFSVTGWSVVLYNGTGGAVYDTRPLNGTIPDMCDGRGVIALRFNPDGIQNGPDGFALIDAAGQVVEFASYEGTFAATNGPAATRTSVNIGVSEPGTTPLGHSMRRNASGAWQAPAAGNSIGACNSEVDPPLPAYQNISFVGRTANDIALPVGFQDQVFASVIDEKGDSVETSITWLAETPVLASIDARGVITALGTGTAQFRATTGQGFTRILSLPTHVATPGNTAQYGNNAEFGEPTDGDGSDDYIVRRAQYTSSYNRNRGTPNWVSYNLDSTHIGSLDRCDCFTFDPALPSDFPRYNTADYTGAEDINGYSIDRGHLARSFDRTTGTLDNATTFYFSNIIPQASDLNQGPWADMESNLGDSARLAKREVYIITGVAGKKGTVKNEDKITIPAKVWKVAVIMPRDNGLANVHDYTDLNVIAVIMPNDPGIRNVDWTTYKTTVDEVEALSGYDLLDKLEDQIELLVESADRPPVAVWGGETSGVEGSPVGFDASGSSDPDANEVLTYRWDFGDGTSATGVTPVHAFPDNGVYNVTLTVTDKAGAIDTKSNFVTITNVAPTGVFSTTSPVSEGSSFSVAISGGTDASTKDRVAGFTYRFDCGEGFASWTATSSVSCHGVDNPGYSVSGEIRDKDGGVTPYNAFATVDNVAPSVVIATAPTIYSGQIYSFSGGFGDLGQADAPWQYQIDWGNGTGPITATSRQGAITDSRRYLVAGSYTIGLTVRDKDGGAGAASTTLRVLRLPTAMNVNPGVINTSGAGNGQVIVTVLGNSQFDGSMLRISSIRIGGAIPDTRGNGGFKTAVADTNGDGILDLTVHFNRADLIASASLGSATTELTLHADLNDNRQIEARGSVNVRPAAVR
jgi:DNA/RNA endonuclease G (NUC1)/PKD repeat protein